MLTGVMKKDTQEQILLHVSYEDREVQSRADRLRVW